jgi:hypothetical protein
LLDKLAANFLTPFGVPKVSVLVEIGDEIR